MAPYQPKSVPRLIRHDVHQIASDVVIHDVDWFDTRGRDVRISIEIEDRIE